MSEPVSARMPSVTPEPLLFREINTHSQPASLEAPISGLICELLYASRDLADSNILKPEDQVFASAGFVTKRVCCDCTAVECNGELVHLRGCRVQRVLSLLGRIVATQSQPSPPQSHPNRRKEDARPVDGDQVAEAEARSSPPGDFGEPWKGYVDARTANVHVLLDNREGYEIATLRGAPAEALEHAKRVEACVNFCSGIPTEILSSELPLASERRMRWHEIQHLRQALPWLRSLVASDDSRGVAR